MKKVLLLMPLLVCVSFAQTDRVIEEALKPSALSSNLEKLTDQIGGRVPGTPAMQKAVEWAESAFKASGADSVKTEDFAIKASWAEGATEMSVSVPEHFKVHAVSITWTPALAAHRHVPVFDVGEGTASDFANAGNVAGAIVLVHSPETKVWADLDDEYVRALVTIKQAVKARVLAIAFQSSRPNDLLYRHCNSDQGEIDRLPMVLVAREDAARMSRLLAAGQKVYADLSVPNLIGGPITAKNVIAELRGGGKPDEFIILGAHLDSWDLGTGALDNGCNSALVIDALRAIKASGVKPKRSMRFILFSGEEEGLIGSRAYARAHRFELDKADAVVILDSGVGHVTGFSLGGRKDVVQPISALAAPLRRFDAATFTTDAQTGTDHVDFLLEGVPTLVANQEEDNYLLNYHAMSDTFDKVDLPRLKNHVAVAAAITFAIADAAERLGPRLNREQIEQTFKDSKFDEGLKGFGMWDDWESGKRGREK